MKCKKENRDNKQNFIKIDLLNIYRFVRYLILKYDNNF